MEYVFMSLFHTLTVCAHHTQQTLTHTHLSVQELGDLYKFCGQYNWN